MIVTQMPTLTNPAMLTPDELREELARAQEQLLAMGQKLHDMTGIAHNQATLIDRMVDAHDSNDYEGIRVQLQRLSEHRASFKKTAGKPH